MNIGPAIPIADGWGMHGSGGWWIIGAVVMMLFMGGMMWMMMGGMGHGASHGSSAPRESPDTTKTALDILDRRFAEGEISAEDYRERRETLTTSAPRGRVGAGTNEERVAPDATREEER